MDQKKELAEEFDLPMARMNAELTYATASRSFRKKYDQDVYAPLLDVMGGATRNRLAFKWGHTTEYWEQGKDHSLTEEAWANFTQAYAYKDTNPVWDKMQEVFPEATEIYLEAVRKLIRGEFENE